MSLNHENGSKGPGSENSMNYGNPSYDVNRSCWSPIEYRGWISACFAKDALIIFTKTIHIFFLLIQHIIGDNKMRNIEMKNRLKS